MCVSTLLSTHSPFGEEQGRDPASEVNSEGAGGFNSEDN